MLDAFFEALAGLLAWFYALPLVGYAGAIALLTLTVMILVTPLTLKGTRSMMAMQALQPEMKRIQQEYADDRVKMNEELLAFYKENEINPIGGCLPLLLQMPVFILLYQVIRGLTQIGPNGNFDPKYLDHSSQLYQDLSSTNQMISMGIDLSRSAADALSSSFVEGIPYIAMILVVAASSYIQQKQVSGRNPNAEMPAQQKMLLRVMPAFFAFISFSFPAALVVYFLTSNLYRIGQQAYISKRIYGTDILGRAKDDGAGAGAASAPKDGASSRRTDGGSTKPSRSSRPAPKKDESTDDKPARPPSGRVTPPKSSSSNARRRKKKRS